MKPQITLEEYKQLLALLDKFYADECDRYAYSINERVEQGREYRGYFGFVGAKLDEVCNVKDWVKNRIVSIEYSAKEKSA